MMSILLYLYSRHHKFKVDFINIIFLNYYHGVDFMLYRIQNTITENELTNYSHQNGFHQKNILQNYLITNILWLVKLSK